MNLPDILIPYLLDPRLVTALAAVSVLAGTAIGSLVEYLFPPFWGDTLIVVGFVAAGQGTVPFWAAFAAALLGGTVGAWAAYEAGARLGGLPWLPSRLTRSGRLDRVQGWVQRGGPLALVGNRFLPGVRALFLPLAGALRLSPSRTLWAATGGNTLWLLFLAATVRIAGRLPSSEKELAAAAFLLLLAIPARPLRHG